jgi:hypothetical protein
LLNIENDEIPDWHKNILQKRLEEYEKGDTEIIAWDEVEKIL